MSRSGRWSAGQSILSRSQPMLLRQRARSSKNSFSTCSRRYARPRVTIANGASHRRLRLYRLLRGPQSRLQQLDMRSRAAARSLRLHVRRAVRRRCRVSFHICRRIWTHRWYWFSICLPDLPSQWQTDWTRSARFMSRRRKTEMC